VPGNSTKIVARSLAAESIPCRFCVGEWEVDPALDQIMRGAEVVKLEPRTMRLLVRLADSPGTLVSCRELLDSVWPGVIVGPASVYGAISQLRKLLGDTNPVPRYIATVPRKGYRLIERVQTPAVTQLLPVPESAPTNDASHSWMGERRRSDRRQLSPRSGWLRIASWLVLAVIVLFVAYGFASVRFSNAGHQVAPGLVSIPAQDRQFDDEARRSRGDIATLGTIRTS